MVLLNLEAPNEKVLKEKYIFYTQWLKSNLEVPGQPTIWANTAPWIIHLHTAFTCYKIFKFNFWKKIKDTSIGLYGKTLKGSLIQFNLKML